MNKFSYLLGAVVLNLLVAVPAMAETVRLKAGTFIPVTLAESLTSESHVTGDSIMFRVANDIVVDGKVVIEGGAMVNGTITFAEKSAMVGQAGKISVAMLNTTAVDGTVVTLQGSKTFEGEDETTGTVVVGVVLCPLALLNSGDEAKVGEGTQGRAIVASNFDIEVK